MDNIVPIDKKPVFINKLKTFWSKIPPKIRILSLAAVFIVLITIPTLVVNKNKIIPDNDQNDSHFTIDSIGNFVRLTLPQREAPFFTLSPKTTSKFGIFPQESFSLKSRESISLADLKSNIKTSYPVKISSLNDREFQIIPDQPLKNDQVLNIKLAVADQEIANHKFDRDYSWTFQVQGKFRVTSVLPGDKKKDIPVNTGIEVAFSQDDFENPQKYLKIEPTINYRLEQHGETIAVVPDKPLNYKTVYTVTLLKGLNLQSRNDPIEEDYSFSFQTGEEPKESMKEVFGFSLDKNFIQVTPQEPLMAKVFTYNWPKEQKVTAKVYQFPSGTEFLNSRSKIDTVTAGWYSYFPEKEILPVSGLSLVLQTELSIENQQEIDLLQLPTPLKPGFYFVQFWFDGNKKLEQLWLQSTNLSGYVSTGKIQTVAWVNNLESGQPENQSKIKVAGFPDEWDTNDQGVVTFNTPTGLFEKSAHYLEITNQNQDKLYLPIPSLKGDPEPNEKTNSDYWSYLYHERYMYRSSDTIYFWGIIKNRDTNQPPASVEIALTSGSYGNTEKNSFVSKTITPQNDGSFIGNLSFTDMPDGWYNVNLISEGVSISNFSISISNIVKPEMKIEVKSDKKAIFAGEPVNYEAIIKFFDETAASNVPVKIHEEISSKVTDSNSDRKGVLKYKYQSNYSTESYYPHYETTVFNPALTEDVTIEGYGSAMVYGSRLMITPEYKQNGNKAQIKANVNKINLDDYNSGEKDTVKGDPATKQPVNIKITKTWYDRIENGTYYDFIEKVTRPKYDYKYNSVLMTEKQISTDENGEINYEFEMEKEKSYQTEISVKDSDNRPDSDTGYFYYYENYGYNQSGDEAKAQLLLSNKENNFSLGDTVQFNISLNGKDFPVNEKTKFLFIRAARGRQEAIIQNNPKYNFQFESKYIPNIYVGALVFNGKYYQDVYPSCNWSWGCGYYYNDNGNYFYGFPVNYKQTDSEINLTIKNDKNSYRPGEKAIINVRAEKNGSPLSNSQINLVLVDQALAAIGGVIPPNILTGLYKSVPNQIYFNYYSHQPVLPNKNAAERGGGGGGREIFKDTALFDQKKTNDNGEATFEFTLPDNLTTWLVYAQGVTDSLQVGQKEGILLVTQEFFITNNFPKNYLEKDKPLLSVSSFGNNLDENTVVNFDAIFKKEDQEINKNSQPGKIFNVYNFSFPQLNEGSYKVTLHGKANNLEDTLTLPFTVDKSHFSFNYQQLTNLNAGQEYSPKSFDYLIKDKPVKLIIGDAGRGTYYSSLYKYCYGSSSNRIEKKTAQVIAGNLLKNIFEDDSCILNPEGFRSFQNEDGGLGQVNWGGSVLETSAWIAYTENKPYDRENFIKYFDSFLTFPKNGNIDKIYAAWGLSSLNKPEINKLSILLGQASTFREKAIAALALVSLGETEKARQIYYDLLADYAYEFKPYIRIQSELPEKSIPEDIYLKDTGIALLLGGLVDQKYNPGFYAYLRDFRNYAEDIVLDLSDMSFIKEEMSKAPAEFTKISYVSSQRTIAKNFDKGGSFVIRLSPDELSNFKVKVDQGKVQIRTNYYVSAEGMAGITPDKRVKIKRTYSKAKGDGDLQTGDIVKIQIDFDVDRNQGPRGAYQIADLLPSGLTYLNNPYLYGLKSQEWVMKTDTGIKYTFYNSDWWQIHGSKTLIYYARVNAPGEYIAEPAIIQSNIEPSVFSSTNQENIKISSPNSNQI